MTAEYEWRSHTLLQATYTGLKGTHLIGSFAGSLNVPSVARLVSEVQKGTNLSRTFNNPYGITQNGSVLPETPLQALNPYQNFFRQSLPESYPRWGSTQYPAMSLSHSPRLVRPLPL